MAERSGVTTTLAAVVLGGLVSLAVSLIVGVNSAALQRNAEAATERRHAYVDFATAAATCADLTESDAQVEDERFSKVVDAVKGDFDNFMRNPSTANYPVLSTLAGPDCEGQLQGAVEGLYVIAPTDVWAGALRLQDAAVLLRLQAVLMRHSLMVSTEPINKAEFETAQRDYDRTLEEFQARARIDVLTSAESGLLAPDTVRSLALGLLAVGAAACVVVLVLTVQLRRRLSRMIAASQPARAEAAPPEATVDY